MHYNLNSKVVICSNLLILLEEEEKEAILTELALPLSHLHFFEITNNSVIFVKEKL